MHRPRKHVAIFPAGGGSVDFLRAECGHDNIWMKGAMPTWLPTYLPALYSAIDAVDFSFSSGRALPLNDPDTMPLPTGQFGWTVRLIAPIGGAYPDLWGGLMFCSGNKPSVCLDKSSPCNDCGVDTTPCGGKRGCRHKGRWEYYMVRNRLWRKATGDSNGYLCIGCLEHRLGRMLVAADFTTAPINNPHPYDTERLASRKVATA